MKEIEFQKKDGIKTIAMLSSYLDSIKDNVSYVMTIKEKKERRSLDANSYFWCLLDKLATKLNISKTEMYRQYIKEIGGVSDTVCVIDNAVDKLCQTWQRNGLGWQTDVMPSKIKGCTNVILYYGSSTYNTKQMSDLIALLVQDCIENEIETKTPNEIEALCKEWSDIK